MKKKPSFYKKKLWKVFSQFIRLRDNGTCFTCGLKKNYKQMQAGHFISKSIGGLGLYFHEKNVHCQCYRCNINLGGNGAVYGYRIWEVYGEDIYNELQRLYRQAHTKISINEYESLIEYYTFKVNELLGEK